MKLCSAPGCGKPHKARGLCRMHYERQKRGFRGRIHRLGQFEDCYIPEPNSGCWIWERALTRGTYGQLLDPVSGKHSIAHRVSYERAYGPIPSGLSVLHRCDNPACVNPEHLFLGDQGDNNRDALAKNRHGRAGSRSNGSKLTAETVRAIRSDGGTLPEIARRYGSTQSNVWRILRRETWKHIK